MLPDTQTMQTVNEGEELTIVLARYLRSIENCKDWHNQIRKWRKLYDFDHYSTEPKSMEQQYADPTPTNTVDLAVGIMLANDLGWRAYGWKPSRTEEKETSQVEKYLAGTLEVAKERTQTHITYEITKGFCRDGSAVVYSVWDPRYVERYMIAVEVPDPESPMGVRRIPGFRETPLRTEVIDPLQVTMLPGGDKRWAHIFRTYEMSVFDVEQVFGVTMERYSGLSEDMKMTTKGKVVEYWRHATITKATMGEGDTRPVSEEREVIISGTLFENVWLLKPHIMEGYDELPFTIGFFKPVDFNDPKNWGHSIMRPMETTIALMEQAINRRLYQLTVYSALPLVIKSEFGRKLDIDPGYTNVVQVAPQEDVGFPIWPGNPPDFNQHLDFLRSRLQQSGFSDVMFGSGPSQVSGYALSQLGDQNRIRLEQPRKHLEMFWGTWARKVLSLTANFATNSAVRVYGRMKGRDFAEQVIGSAVAEFMVKCYIKPQFPNEQTRKHAMATQVKGTLSDRTIMENYLDIEQPDDERDKKLEEMADTHPLMQQYVMLSLLMERAESGDKAAAMVVAGMQQQMTQPQSGPAPTGSPPPPPGGGPDNALGMPSAGGEETPQAGGMEPPGQGEAALMSELAGAAPGFMGGGSV